MAELNFFQSIFCIGDVNIYESEEDKKNTLENLVTENIEIDNDLETKEVDVEVSENNDLIKASFMEDNKDDAISFDFSNNVSKDNQVYKTDFTDDNVETMDLTKTPIVSGLIFDDADDLDGTGFDFTYQEKEKEPVEEIDASALNLIEKLKSDGIEKERAKQAIQSKNQEIYKNETKLESVVDMPLL